MAKTTTAKRAKAPGKVLGSKSSPTGAKARIRKTMDFDREKLAKVRRILGSDSDTQAVDSAMDVIIANQEIGAAMEAVFGSIPDFEVT